MKLNHNPRFCDCVCNFVIRGDSMRRKENQIPGRAPRAGPQKKAILNLLQDAAPSIYLFIVGGWVCPPASCWELNPAKQALHPQATSWPSCHLTTKLGWRPLVQMSEELCKDCRSRAPSSQEMKTHTPNTLLGVIPGVPIEHSWVGLKPNINQINTRGRHLGPE